MAKKVGNDDLVYHYCDVESFLNIIQNSTIWLSDILKSNDSKEGTWIKDKINNKIIEYLAETDNNALHAWNTWYEQDVPYGAIIYVACFSERVDCLSQWRGYAQDGQGLAIGFSKKYLQELSMPYSLLFNRVIYSEKRQQEFINKIANENILKMSKKGVGHVALELSENYLKSFPLYKNPSFEEEQEWRIIFLANPRNQKDVSLGNFHLRPPKFRANKDKIISYLELDFTSIKTDIIKEIWIGPKSKVTLQDLLNILATNNYYENRPYSSEEPILIQYSKSSYR